MKVYVLVIVGMLMLVSKSIADVDQFFLNDGKYHLVDDGRYSTGDVFLDEYTPNYPGTHVELVSPGVIGGFVVGYNNSKITITSGGLAGVSAKGNCKAVINDGIVGMGAHVDDFAELTINGGTIEGISGTGVEAWNNGYASIYGGTINGLLRTWGDGFIELHGQFSVDGVVLQNYESLRDYGTRITDSNYEWLTGTVTGRLADGSIFESEYYIMEFDYWNPITPNGDIIACVEPLISSVVPSGGETYLAGDQLEIKWFCQSGIENVKIEFSADFGQIWTEIATVAASDLSYLWTTPQVNSQWCLVRITDVDMPYIYGDSDDSFTVYVCTLEADVTGDCMVNIQDFAIFVSEWLEDSNPFE